MSFTEEKFNDALDKYTDIERKIQRKNASEYRDIITDRTKEIIKAYNNTINTTKSIWTDKNLNRETKLQIKEKLDNIFERTEKNLKKLNANAIFPSTFTEEIKLKNEADRQSDDEILTESNTPYDTDKLNELLNDFDDWDKKITRKNASQDEDKIQERTQAIINAYNNLVEFGKPIINNNSERSTKRLRDEISTRNEYIRDDLKKLNADYKIPEDITQKIITRTENENNKPESNSNKSSESTNTPNNNSNKSSDGTNTPSDNSNKQNDNKKDSILPTINTNSKKNDKNTKEGNQIQPENKLSPIAPKQEKSSKMAMTENEYFKICNQQLNTTYSGDPITLPPLLDAIELLQFRDKNNEFGEILLRVLKTKLAGEARDNTKEQN